MALADLTQQAVTIANGSGDAASKLAQLRAIRGKALVEKADASNGNGDVNPKDYDSLLSAIQSDESRFQGEVDKANAQSAATALKATPAGQNAGQAAQSTEIANNAANGGVAASNLDIQRLQLDNQRLVNQASTSDNTAKIQAAQLALNQSAQQWKEQIQAAQQQGRDTTALLQQAKADLAQKAFEARSQLQADTLVLNQQKADIQAAKNQDTNAVSLIGQESTSANNRASNAATILDRAGQMGGDVAKGGGTADQIGKTIGGMLQLAPSFQNQMGGAPVAFDANHFQQVLNIIKSGQVQPDANGNVVPNALKAVAQKAGVLQPSGGPPPSPPQFTAPMMGITNRPAYDPSVGFVPGG